VTYRVSTSATEKRGDFRESRMRYMHFASDFIEYTS